MIIIIIILILSIIGYMSISYNKNPSTPIIKYYVINLDKRTNRLKKIINELNKHKINFNRISAINGNTLNYKEMGNDIIDSNSKDLIFSKNKTWGVDLTKGAVGLGLTFKNILYENINKNNNSNFIIFEDDIKLKPNFNKELRNLYKNMPNDWDLIYLGYSMGDSVDKSNMLNKMLFIPNQNIYGLFGTLISKKGAFKLYKILTPLTHQIDTQISNHFKDLNVYLLKNPIVTSPPSEKDNSDIQIF